MNELTGMYDQDPTQPYGYGEDGEKFATQEEANAYMNRTMQEAKARGENRSKTVRVTNPPRERQILQAITIQIDDALDGGSNAGFPGIQRLIDQHHITEAEATTALQATDFYDSWLDWKEGWED